MKLIKFLIIICSFVLISGCARNNVVTLMKASKEKTPIIPTKAIVDEQLKERAFKLGAVFFNDTDFESTDLQNISPEALENLLKINIEECFNKSNITTGKKPHYIVNISIEDIKLLKGSRIIPNLSILRAKIEITQPNGNQALVRGQYETRYLKEVPIILPGIVGVIPWPSTALQAISKMFPAMAVVITDTIEGLQQGKSLEEIKIYPDLLLVGGIIVPDIFLKNNKYGIKPMDYKVIAEILKKHGKQKNIPAQPNAARDR